MGGVHPPASVEAGAPARYGQARYDSAAGEHDSAPPATSPTIGGREARAPFRLSPPRPEPHTGILPLGEAALSLYAPAQPRPPSVEAFSSVVPIGGSAGPAGPAEKGCPAASSGLRSSMAPVAATRVHEDCCADGTEVCATRAGATPSNFEEFIYQTWGRGIAKQFAVPYNRKL